MKIDGKKAAILLTAVTMAAIMSGIALSTYAADNGQGSENGYAGWTNGRMMMAGLPGWAQGRPPGRGCYGPIQVSEAFEENVVNIATNDTDVQNLLDEGYNVTAVRPIITTIVEADGTVATKATSAVVMLKLDESGHAAVWVNLEEARVTEIVILTRTVIEKP